MPTQADQERTFIEHPDPAVRTAAYHWFIAPPQEAPGRERIPLELIYESSVDESSGVGVMVNMRQVILRGMPDCARNNPETRAEIVSMLQRYQEDRRTLDRDRTVAAEMLASLEG